MDHHTMSASRVHRGCVLNLFSERYSIDLVSIPLQGSKVIIEMEWLEPNGAMINCEQQLVRVRNLSVGELVIPGEGASHGPALCSLARGRRYLQQGCSGFLAYVADTRVEGKSELNRMLIVRDFPDVFPKDLPRVPPEGQVEFQIDLVPGAAPLAKAPYHLAPPEMQELSTQLHKFLDKGFILPRSSSWGAPILFVKKNEGSHRMCID